MSQVEAGVFGYISGLIVGTFLLVFLFGWYYYNQPDSGKPPEWYSSTYKDMELIYESHQTTFTLLFALGFICGVGGSGSFVTIKYNQNNENK